MPEPSIIVGLVFPLAFVVLGIIVNRVMMNPRAGNNRAFHVGYKRGANSGDIQIELAQLRTELTEVNNGTKTPPFSFLGKADEIDNIRELDPTWQETSIAIELCIGAISANLTSLVEIGSILSSNSNSTNVTSNMQLYVRGIVAGPVILVASFIILLLAMYILKNYKDHENRPQRIAAIWITNIFGFTILILSFAVLGRLIQ